MFLFSQAKRIDQAPGSLVLKCELYMSTIRGRSPCEATHNCNMQEGRGTPRKQSPPRLCRNAHADIEKALTQAGHPPEWTPWGYDDLSDS